MVCFSPALIKINLLGSRINENKHPVQDDKYSYHHRGNCPLVLGNKGTGVFISGSRGYFQFIFKEQVDSWEQGNTNLFSIIYFLNFRSPQNIKSITY